MAQVSSDIEQRIRELKPSHRADKSKSVRRGVGSAVAIAALTLGGVLALVSSPAQAATTTLRVCSHIGTDYYNILGGNAANLRAKLNSADNFGPTGTYGDYSFNFFDLGDDLTQQKLEDGDCNVYFSGYESDGSASSRY